MNISEITEKYVVHHPSIKDCLSMGIINYSALSRKISSEENFGKKVKLDAILIAARRLYDKFQKEELRDSKIIRLLKNSKVDVQNKVLVAIVEKNIYFDNLLSFQKKVKNNSELFHSIEGTDTITIVTREDYLDDINQMFDDKVVKIRTNLAKIVIKSSKDIEETSGVFSYLTSLFSDNNINIFETMSCWTDTILVIDENDVGKALSILRF